MTVHMVGLPQASNYLNKYTLTAAPAGDHQENETFQSTELPGLSLRQKQYPPKTGRIITQVYVQHWSPCFILHYLFRTKHMTRSFLELTGDFCWLDSPGCLLHHPLVLVVFQGYFSAGKTRRLFVIQTARQLKVPDTGTPSNRHPIQTLSTNPIN